MSPRPTLWARYVVSPRLASPRLPPPPSHRPTPLYQQQPYLKLQPPDKRKLGFGSHDAHKTDEFTVNARTEQYVQRLLLLLLLLHSPLLLLLLLLTQLTSPLRYRETLKAEQRLINAHRDVAKEKEILEKAANAPKPPFLAGATEAEFLYDIGRDLETKFDAKCHRDRFYSMAHPHMFSRTRRDGSLYTTASDYGVGVADVAPVKNQFARNQATKAFYDRSHLGG